MVNISKIDEYQDIEKIRQETKERKIEVDLQHKLEPYNKVYSCIHAAKDMGESDCTINPWLFDNKEVKEFFINEGFTIDEPVTIREYSDSSVSIKTTIRISWATNRIGIV